MLQVYWLGQCKVRHFSYWNDWEYSNIRFESIFKISQCLSIFYLKTYICWLSICSQILDEAIEKQNGNTMAFKDLVYEGDK